MLADGLEAAADGVVGREVRDEVGVDVDPRHAHQGDREDRPGDGEDRPAVAQVEAGHPGRKPVESLVPRRALSSALHAQAERRRHEGGGEDGRVDHADHREHPELAHRGERSQHQAGKSRRRGEGGEQERHGEIAKRVARRVGGVAPEQLVVVLRDDVHRVGDADGLDQRGDHRRHQVQRIAEPRHGAERPQVGDGDAEKRDQDAPHRPEREEDDQRQKRQPQRDDSLQVREQEVDGDRPDVAGARDPRLQVSPFLRDHPLDPLVDSPGTRIQPGHLLEMDDQGGGSSAAGDQVARVDRIGEHALAHVGGGALRNPRQEGLDHEVSLAAAHVERREEAHHAVHALHLREPVPEPLHRRQDLGNEDIVGGQGDQHDVVFTEELAGALEEESPLLSRAQQSIHGRVEFEQHPGRCGAEVDDARERQEGQRRHQGERPPGSLRDESRGDGHPDLPAGTSKPIRAGRV